MVVVIKMRGLPFEASARDIREFYRGLEIKENEIHLAPNENGKASGVAFAIFLNDDDARKAMYRDGRYLGKRYVNLFLSSIHEMHKILREGVHERRKVPAINVGEPTANANKLNPERNKSESAQIRSRGNERNGRTSRNQGENSRSDRSRSPLRSHNDELTPRRYEGISMSASSGLAQLLESRRRYEQQESLDLLATLSKYELLELERQLMATENRGYRDIDLKNTLLGQDSTVSLSRLSQEKLTESPWGFPQSYEPNRLAMVHEDLKSEHIRDRVAEPLNRSHNADSLVCSTDLGLGRITAGHDLYHEHVLGRHDCDPVMLATGGFDYIYEKVGEDPEQNPGLEKVLGGHAHPRSLNYEKMTRVRDNDVDQGRLQERQNRSHERVNGRHDQNNASGKVAGEQDHNYKRERRERDQGREKSIGGRHHAGKHEKGTVGNDRKHERLNKGHVNHNQEKVVARGHHHASDRERVHERPDQRNGRAAEGQKSSNEKVAGHRDRDNSHGKAAVGHGSNHIKKESKTHKLDHDGERQKARHDCGYKVHKINHDGRKISGKYDRGRTSGGHSSQSIGSGNNGRRQDDFKNDDENDVSRGICINMVGLPYSCTEAEVAEFFKGLRLISIHLRRNISGSHVGKTNGEAFVVFRSLDDCMQAVDRNHHYIRDRYVKVRKCPKEVMYEAIQQEVDVFGDLSVQPGDYVTKDSNQGLNSQLSSGIASEIGLCNELPAFNYSIPQPGHPGMDATPSFGQEMIQQPTVYGYTNDNSGRDSAMSQLAQNMIQPTVYGYTNDNSGHDSAMSQLAQEMIQPTVYGYTNDNSGHDSAMSQLAQGANINVSDIKAGCVLGIRNLPSTVTADEILDFFYGFRVIPDSIRIHYLAPGRSSGDAIVTFMDDKEARLATEQLNHKSVRRRNVQLFPV